MTTEDCPLLAEGIKEKAFFVGGTVAINGAEGDVSISDMSNESCSITSQVNILENEMADPIPENESDNILSPLLGNNLPETSGEHDYIIIVKNEVECNHEDICRESDDRNGIAQEEFRDNSEITHVSTVPSRGNSDFLEETSLLSESENPQDNIVSLLRDNALRKTNDDSNYVISKKNEIECYDQTIRGETEDRNEIALATFKDDCNIVHESAVSLCRNEPLEDTSLLLKNEGSEGRDCKNDTIDNVLNYVSSASIGDVKIKSERQVIKSCSLDLTQLIFATVKIEDIFEGNTRYFGQSHSNDGTCFCIFCQGEFRVSDWPQLLKSQSNARAILPKVEKNLDPVHQNNFNCKTLIKFKERPLKSEFFCNLCPATFKSKKGFTSHKKTHSNVALFKCDVCTREFTDDGALKEHMLIHNTDRPNKCEYCSRAFKHFGDLISHKRLHSGKNTVRCKFCSKLFRAESILQMHLRTHTGEKPFSCEVCHATFKQKSQIKIHMRCVHRNERPYSCSVCSAPFKQCSALNAHMKYAHGSESPFKCTVCPSTFKDKRYLKHHMFKHATERPWECDLCKRKFKSKDHIRSHLALQSCGKYLFK